MAPAPSTWGHVRCGSKIMPCEGRNPVTTPDPSLQNEPPAAGNNAVAVRPNVDARLAQLAKFADHAANHAAEEARDADTQARYALVEASQQIPYSAARRMGTIKAIEHAKDAAEAKARSRKWRQRMERVWEAAFAHGLDDVEETDGRLP